ncbi:hypothetical protein COJ42_13750 [Bacillus cereus]|nr:hypothetical protein CN464_07305 [Bacillus cereus]PFM33861.1 hypothetical protein COJ42_13750 [Bacillus cereus]PFP92819.1 hypothetical protein COK02_12470 [Bacillus cereus]
MLDATKIQSIIEKLQKEKYDIQSSLIDVLRIARQRLDIKEILFLEYNIHELSDGDNLAIVDKVKILSDRKGIPGSEYVKIANDIGMIYTSVRKHDLFDISKNEIRKEQIVSMPVSGLISDFEKFHRALEGNVIPPGLHPQDLYFANQKKNMFDAFYNHQISVITDILNKVKSFMLTYLIDLDEILSNTEGDKQMSTQQTQTVFSAVRYRGMIFRTERTSMTI